MQLAELKRLQHSTELTQWRQAGKW